MIRTCIVVPVLALSLSAVAHIAAQQSDRAALLLQAAEQKDKVEGDLAAAIKQYQALASQYAKTNRALAAQALLRMASAYHKLGDAQAQKTWARIVAEFADQPVVVAEARRHLASSRSATRAAASLPVSRQITAHYSTADIVTPDGRYLVGTDWDTGDLLIRDLTTGEERRPVRGRLKGGRLADWAEDPAFAPDMSQIAYSWFSEDDAGRTTNSLRIVATTPGSVAREVVRRDYNTGWLAVARWSADLRSLLVTVNGPLPDRRAEIAWVSLETGVSRTLMSFEPWQVRQAGRALDKVSLSPDGRWIAFSVLAARGSGDRHVYLLGADGAGPTRLTTTAGTAVSPAWTTDGSKVLFVADWSGSFGLWSMPVRNGQAAGQPVLVKADMGQVDAIGVTAAGSYFYNYRYDSGWRSFVTRGMKSKVPVPAPERVTTDFDGGLAAWSPDGNRVAFVRQRRSGDRTISELAVRVTATGEERVFNARAVSPQRPLWFHTRQAVLVFAADDGASATAPPFMSGGAFFAVDLDTGRFSKVLPVLSERYRRSPVAALSPDDRTLFTMGDALSSAQVSFDDVLAVDLEEQRERAVYSISSPGDMRATPAGVGLALSPDGRTLAVASRAGNRDANRPWMSDQTTLFVVGADGSGYRQLHGPYVSVTSAKVLWSRDGSAVHFVRASAAGAQLGWEVMSIPREGGSPVATGLDMHAFRRTAADATTAARLERLSATLDSVDLHPDGGSLLLSSTVNPKFEIWALDGVSAGGAAGPR